jgi:hypothetical protein
MTGIGWAALLAWIGAVRAAGAEAQAPPGVVVDYSPASSGVYIGSPSIARLPDGTYVASHDQFGPGSTSDRTLVFGSSDRGRTWSRLCEIAGQWWSTLFVHRGALYLIGTDREEGRVVIRRSADGGRTWTEPRDERTGLLIASGRYHCAPVPVVLHDGRIWRAMEDALGPGGWGSHFNAFMLSAPEDADLLDAARWTASNRLGRNPAWLGGTFNGWLEGNAVVTRDGRMLDILRVDCPSDDEVAAFIDVSSDGKTARFDPARGFVPFPGGAKKFTIRYDARSHRYWSLVNYVPHAERAGKPASTRNTLALVCSPDLRRWEVRAILLHHPDPVKHGFQYVDWLFEGEDLVAVIRTAYDDGASGAHNFHDANYLTFHRFRQFRRLRDADPDRAAVGIVDRTDTRPAGASR